MSSAAGEPRWDARPDAPGGDAPPPPPAPGAALGGGGESSATDHTLARIRSTHVGLAAGLVILAVILDFIIQNLNEATIHFFAASFRLPIGILVLGGALAGGVIVLLVSLFRVVQVRRTNRRQHQATGPG